MRQDRPLQFVMHSGIPLLAFGLTAMLPVGSGGWSLSLVLFAWASASLSTLLLPGLRFRTESVDLVGALAVVALTGGVSSTFAPLLPIVIVITGARRGTGVSLIRATIATLVLASATTLISPTAGAPAIEQGAAALVAMAIALHVVAWLSGRLNHRWRALEEEHDSVIVALEEGIIVTDASGRVVRANPSARRLLEFPDGDDWRGQLLSDLFRRKTDEDLRDALGEPRTTASSIEWRPREGTSKFFQIRTTEVDGGLRVAVFADRTSQRRTLEVEARLVHLEELEQLALGLAHEIRNPLASLRGAAVELASGTLPPQQAERMEAIVLRESDRLDRTVDDFLEYSRSRRVEHSEAVNLAEVVEEVIESVSGRQDARDVQMTRQCQQGAVILGDRDGLHQVVNNLTINALEAGAQKIGFVIALQGDHLRLEISDDGSGMTPELQSRAFLPFVSTKTREGGLGLALVKKIVDSAAGWIEVESLQGEGTTFLITLPVAVSVPQKVGAR